MNQLLNNMEIDRLPHQNSENFLKEMRVVQLSSDWIAKGSEPIRTNRKYVLVNNPMNRNPVADDSLDFVATFDFEFDMMPTNAATTKDVAPQ